VRPPRGDHLVDREELRSTLTIPLYWTVHIEDIEDFEGLTDRQLEELRQQYTPEDIAAMAEALAWAQEHPEEKFSLMLPALGYSDQVLHRYLSVLNRQFQTEALGTA
jgi:hypothetical protein